MRYGKHALRRVREAHNAAHDVMAATDRAKAIARRTGSPGDARAVREQLRREERAKEALIETEKRERGR